MDLLGALLGMLLAMALQGGIALYVVYRFFDPHPGHGTIALALGLTWLVSYLIGWAMNGQLFSEQTIDPGKCRAAGYGYASDHARDGLILAILQFVCGALYTGVQALLGRKV